MKLFLSIFVLVFNLQSLANSDDIKEFQIEGMSIGDSVLDFFSKKEIEKFSVNYAERVDYKYSQMEIFKNQSMEHKSKFWLQTKTQDNHQSSCSHDLDDILVKQGSIGSILR